MLSQKVRMLYQLLQAMNDITKQCTSHGMKSTTKGSHKPIAEKTQRWFTVIDLNSSRIAWFLQPRSHQMKSTHCLGCTSEPAVSFRVPTPRLAPTNKRFNLTSSSSSSQVRTNVNATVLVLIIGVIISRANRSLAKAGRGEKGSLGLKHSCKWVIIQNPGAINTNKQIKKHK